MLLVLAKAFVGFAPGLVEDCSFRDEYLVLIGIFPLTYLAARPAPCFMGGRRRAMMVVDRGMMVVSSSYSNIFVSTGHG